jgi:hypothetical protein
VYEGRTRRERHEELVAFGIQGGIQARTYELAGGKGASTPTSCGKWAAPSASRSASWKGPRA